MQTGARCVRNRDRCESERCIATLAGARRIAPFRLGVFALVLTIVLAAHGSARGQDGAAARQQAIEAQKSALNGALADLQSPEELAELSKLISLVPEQVDWLLSVADGWASKPETKDKAKRAVELAEARMAEFASAINADASRAKTITERIAALKRTLSPPATNPWLGPSNAYQAQFNDLGVILNRKPRPPELRVLLDLWRKYASAPEAKSPESAAVGEIMHALLDRMLRLDADPKRDDPAAWDSMHKQLSGAGLEGWAAMAELFFALNQPDDNGRVAMVGSVKGRIAALRERDADGFGKSPVAPLIDALLADAEKKPALPADLSIVLSRRFLDERAKRSAEAEAALAQALAKATGGLTDQTGEALWIAMQKLKTARLDIDNEAVAKVQPLTLARIAELKEPEVTTLLVEVVRYRAQTPYVAVAIEVYPVDRRASAAVAAVREAATMSEALVGVLEAAEAAGKSAVAAAGRPKRYPSTAMRFVLALDGPPPSDFLASTKLRWRGDDWSPFAGDVLGGVFAVPCANLFMRPAPAGSLWNAERLTRAWMRSAIEAGSKDPLLGFDRMTSISGREFKEDSFRKFMLLKQTAVRFAAIGESADDLREWDEQKSGEAVQTAAKNGKAILLLMFQN